MTLRDEPSDTGARKTVSVRFKEPTTRCLQVVAHTLFAGAYTGAIEAAFLEYIHTHGYVSAEIASALPFPTLENATSSGAVGDRIDEFLLFADALSVRLESMAERGRVAVVDPSLFLAFVRAAATFPGPLEPFTIPPADFIEQHAHSFTLQPRHIVKIDEVGVHLFGRDRKRRAVLETALLWFAERHGLSETAQVPVFEEYPFVDLIATTRQFTRHVRALLEAMRVLGPAVGEFRMWSVIDKPFKASTNRLGNALFQAARRDA